MKERMKEGTERGGMNERVSEDIAPDKRKEEEVERIKDGGVFVIKIRMRENKDRNYEAQK